MATTQNMGNEISKVIMSQMTKDYRDEISKNIKRGMAQAKATKAVIYTRVSSMTRQENSIAGQTAILMEYAQKHNLKIVAVFNEFGSTRSSQRPALSSLLQVALRGNIGKVLCVSLDRISRSHPEMKQITEFLKKKGVEIITP